MHSINVTFDDDEWENIAATKKRTGLSMHDLIVKGVRLIDQRLDARTNRKVFKE